MGRISIAITEPERWALIQLAEQERRDPRDQAAIILRRGLVAAGMLPASDSLSLVAQSQTDVAGAEAGEEARHE